MFEIESVDKLLENCRKRDKLLTDVNISSLSVNDTNYVSFISKYDKFEITPDIVVFNYEEAIKANNYLSREYPEIANEVWQIGCTGIGDQWFIDKESLSILFFDHDQGVYTDAEFTDLNIDFKDFLQVASLVRSLEDFLDDNTDFDKEKVETEFMTALNGITPELYENYPYNYWN